MPLNHRDAARMHAFRQDAEQLVEACRLAPTGGESAWRRLALHGQRIVEDYAAICAMRPRPRVADISKGEIAAAAVTAVLPPEREPGETDERSDEITGALAKPVSYRGAVYASIAEHAAALADGTRPRLTDDQLALLDDARVQGVAIAGIAADEIRHLRALVALAALAWTVEVNEKHVNGRRIVLHDAGADVRAEVTLLPKRAAVVFWGPIAKPKIVTLRAHAVILEQIVAQPMPLDGTDVAAAEYTLQVTGPRAWELLVPVFGDAYAGAAL